MFTKLSEIGQTLCLVFATIGTAILSFLGGWDMLLSVLVAFIVTDYITGIICAIIDKKLSSAVGFKGIAKKIFILILVGLSYMLDQAMGTAILRNIAILFYIANEGISILENAGKLGVPYPEKLKDILVQLKKNNDKEITENTEVK
jgi:toxin secretion/phage lysis holin